MIHIIFDGTKNRPLDFTDQHKQNYIQKNYIKTNPYIMNDPLIIIKEFDNWTHQANSLKQVMTEHCDTPFYIFHSKKTHSY